MIDFDSLSTMFIAQVVSWTPRVLGALAILFVGRLVAGWAKKLAGRALARSNVDPILVPFASGLTYVGLMTLVVIAAVTTLGVSTTSFVAVLGAAGLAIALAFQGTLSNFSSGVMLLTFRPFKVGDLVEIGGTLGKVKEVAIFSCLLATPDNVEVRVPNSEVFGKVIKNYTASGTRRVDLVVGVSYDDDLGVAVRTCMDVIAADSRVLSEPEPVVAVHEMADSSVNLVVRPWVNTPDYWNVRWDLTRALKESLESAGCTIPFPQRDVHLHQVA
jgi:small conductance mechanosensitive channel